jgi:pilus assembly protein CpaE
MSSNNGKMRVLIAARERPLRDQLRQLAMSVDGREVVATATDGQEAIQLAVLLKPDVALIKHDLPIYDGLSTTEMINLAAPSVKCVLIGDGQPEGQTLRKAMMAGARAYLPTPVSAADLGSAMDGFAQSAAKGRSDEFKTASNPSLLPQVIVVTGGKGGVGKSTTATSLAMCLAKRHPGKVMLFDLYTQFGDVATMTNVTPCKRLVELVGIAEEIDADMVQTCVCEHETGMNVLISSIAAEPLDAISTSAAEAVLHALKRSYTYIVIDLPPMLHATTLYVLAHAHRLLLITTLFDLPTLRDTKQFYDMVVGNYVPEEKVMLIANRVSKHDGLNNEDVKRLFGRSISATIPNDRRLVAAMNRGVPFVRAYAHSPMAAAVDKIAEQMTDRSLMQMTARPRE